MTRDEQIRQDLIDLRDALRLMPDLKDKVEQEKLLQKVEGIRRKLFLFAEEGELQ